MPNFKSIKLRFRSVQVMCYYCPHVAMIVVFKDAVVFKDFRHINYNFRFKTGQRNMDLKENLLYLT